MDAVRTPFSLILAVVALPSASCAPVGSYVWVDDYHPEKLDAPAYVVGPGDILQVRVFNQEQLSARVKVRGDGRVSLPLLNDVQAAGTTPVALAQTLEGK